MLRYDVLFVDVLYEIYEIIIFSFFCMDAELFKKIESLFSSRLAKKIQNKKRGRNLFKDDQISHFQQFVLFLI